MKNTKFAKYYIVAIVLSVFSVMLLANIVVNARDEAWIDAGIYLGGLILFLPSKASIQWMSISVQGGLKAGANLQHWIGVAIIAICALLKLLI